MFGNRAVYDDGWLAGTVHRAPWEREPRHPLADDVWELCDVRADFSCANDLAAAQPEKLQELQALFMKEAEAHHVLPIDDRLIGRANATLAGRPDSMAGRTSLTLGEGMTGMSENVFINVKNKSVILTAEIEVPPSGANGAILVQGGRFGGWALYVKDGVPGYAYNFLGMQRTTIAAKTALAPGKATVRFDFAYDGGGIGKGGTGTLFVDDAKRRDEEHRAAQRLHGEVRTARRHHRRRLRRGAGPGTEARVRRTRQMTGRPPRIRS